MAKDKFRWECGEGKSGTFIFRKPSLSNSSGLSIKEELDGQGGVAHSSECICSGQVTITAIEE